MKKLLVIMAALFLAVTLSACNSTTTTTGTTGTTGSTEPAGNFDVADGFYFAIADQAAGSGYRSWVVVEVANKHIVNIEWNAYHVDGGEASCLGADKYSCSVDGLYDMNNDGGKGTWDAQADTITEWVIDNQDLDLTFTGSKADGITSVSIKTQEFFTLANAALAKPAVAQGSYANDGFYYFETTKSDKDYAFAAQAADGTALPAITGSFKNYSFATFIIVNGTIVHADFNATTVSYEYVTDANGAFVKSTETITFNGKDYTPNNIVKYNAEGNPVKKYVTKDSAKEWYGMAQIGKVEWYLQMQDVEAELIEAQELVFVTNTTTNKLAIDGVTSATVTVTSIQNLIDQLDVAAN